MRRALIAIVLSLLAAPALAGVTNRDLNRQIDQTNFLVNDDCSGTLIDRERGYIITANHCIQDQFQDVERDELQKDGTVKKVKVRISRPGTVSQIVFDGPSEVSKTSFVFKVKAHDLDHDLGLLQVISKLPNTQDVKLSCEEPARLDTVYAVGNPFAVLYSSATKGIVASTARDYRMLGIDGNGDDPDSQPGDNALIQSTAPIEGGNSGGALLNADGDLVGVNVRGSRMNETVAFAVPLDDVRRFLKDNGVDLPECK
jgi:S1-C subfamily serine protease